MSKSCRVTLIDVQRDEELELPEMSGGQHGEFDEILLPEEDVEGLTNPEGVDYAVVTIDGDTRTYMVTPSVVTPSVVSGDMDYRYEVSEL